MTEARPLDQYLQNDAFPDSLKTKLSLVRSIVTFAEDSLGLRRTGSYQSMYNCGDSTILWIVTAAPRFQLEPYEWKFGFLGRFPYKGYFVRSKAVKLRNEMEEKGFDASVREVSAWSTLGWLKDPFLSSLLYQSPGRIANVVIHELTHATLYVKDSADFNENLATFIGDQGALQYLLHRFGKGSEQVKEYKNYLTDKKIFEEYVMNRTQQLDNIYSMNQPEGELLKQKNKLIESFVEGVKDLPLSKPDKWHKHLSEKEHLNNTYFLSFKRYSGRQNELEKEFLHTFNQNFNDYLTYLTGKYKLT